MPGGNKKIGIDIGVDFKVEGNQLEQYVNRVKESINSMQSGGKKGNAFSGTEKALNDLVTQYDKLSKIKLNTDNVGDYIRQQDKLRQAIVAVNQAAKSESSDLTAKQEKYNETIRKATAQQVELQKIIDGTAKKDDGSAYTEKEIKAATRSYNGYTGVIKKAENGLKTLNNETQRQQQILNGVDGAVNQANNALRDNAVILQKAAEAEAEANKQSLINNIKQKISYYTSLAFSIRLVRQQLQQAIKTFQDVDKSITSISMVSGISRDTLWGNIGEYNKLAQELGTTTDKVLQASQLYYQQGRNTIEVVELTRESLTLAAIAGLETADATNYLTAAVNGYKMEASEAGEVTDVWAQLAAKNAVSVKELAVSISKVASIAQSAGMDIQSTSAFLTQMIATTREAPENLGTALKTIIARFQELKQSGAALEDGVDANKVEKALKTVGIELRDTTGQFRDFDDVILELSSKWDDLDRNTQRYIATIAAGSRQQSRFIALVSDYDGLVEIMDQAANAEGAADEQFQIYSTGMEAALNRMKSAWQGFYLSWEDGHNVITTVLSGVTNILNVAAKIGIKSTAGILALGAALVKAGAAMLINQQTLKQYIQSLGVAQLLEKSRTNRIKSENAALLLNSVILKAEHSINQQLSRDEALEIVRKKALRAGIDGESLARAEAIILEQGETISVKGLTLALQALNKATPLGWLTIVIGLLSAAIPLFTNLSRRSEELEQRISDLNSTASEAKQNAKTAQQYADALEDAVKAGEDTAEIREQIAEALGDEINGTVVATASWRELTEALKKYSEEQEKISAGNAFLAATTSQEKDAEIPKPSKYDQKYYVGDNYFDEALYQEDLEKYNKAVAELTQQYISLSVAKTAAASVPHDEELSSEQIDQMAAAIQHYATDLVNFNEKTGEWIITNQTLFNEILSYGDLGSKSLQDLQNIYDNQASAEAQAYIQTWITSLENGEKILNDQLTAIFSNPATVSGITSKLSPELTREFASAFESLGNDGELQADYQEAIKTIMSQVDPAELSEGTFQAVAEAVRDGQDGLMDLYESLITVGVDGKVVVSDFAASIGELLTDSNKAFVEGKKAVDNYNQGLKDLDELTSAASLDDYAQKIWQLSLNYETLGYATQEELLAELWANTVRDESGNYIIQEGSLLASLREEYDLNNAASRNSAIVTLQTELGKLKAYRDGLQGFYDYIVGILEGYGAGEEGAVDNAVVSEDAINAIVDTYNTIMPELEADAEALGEAPIGLGGIAQAKNTGNLTVKNLKAYAEKIKARIDGINSQMANMTQQIGMLQAMNLSSPTKGGGGGGGGSGSSSKEQTEATKKLSEVIKEAIDAIKELNDDLKDSAKLQISLIKAELENRKKAKETELEVTRKHNKIYFEEYKARLQKELDELKKKIDEEKEALETEKKNLEDTIKPLDRKAKAVQDAYNIQIDLIQKDIDALDKEAEAEDRLRKLQEARDAYERARNQRTRLVLTQGAGWIFKTDTEALNQARDGLKDAQRDYQKSVLQDEIKALETQRDEWAKIAENIGKSAEEAKLYEKALEDAQGWIANGTIGAQKDTFETEVVGTMTATDSITHHEERIEGLEKEYDFQNDASKPGSIANIMSQVDDQMERIGWSLEDYEDWQYRQNVAGEIDKKFNPNQIEKQYDQYFSVRFKNFETKQQDLLNEIKTITGSIEAYAEIEKRIDKTAAEIKEEEDLQKKYSKASLDELLKSGSYFSELDKTIGNSYYKKDRYDLSKITDEASGKTLSDKIIKDLQDGVISITEANYWLKELELKQKAVAEKEKAEEAAKKNSGGSMGGGNGGVSGSSSAPSSSGGTPPPSGIGPTTDHSGSNPMGSESNKVKITNPNQLSVEKIQSQFASSAVYSAASDAVHVDPHSNSAGVDTIHTRNTTVNHNYEIQVTTQAATTTALIKDATRQAQISRGSKYTPMTK